MKKQLLLSAVTISVAISAQATEQLSLRMPQGSMPQPVSCAAFDLSNNSHIRVLAENNDPAADEPTVTSGTLTWGYSDNIYSATALGEGLQNIIQAIGVPSNITSLYKGNSITAFNIPTGANFGEKINENYIARDGYLWIARDLDAEPIYKQAFHLTANYYEMNSIELETPFPIDGTPFFAGYTIEGGNFGDMSAPVVFSYTVDYTGYGSIIGTTIKGQNQWIDGGSQIGNITFTFDISGETIPLNALMTFGDLEIPETMGINDTFEATVALANLGYKTINSVGLSVYNTTTPEEDREVNTIDFGGDGMAGEPGTYIFTINNLQPTAVGESDMVLDFKTVNGQPNMVTKGSALSAPVFVLEEGQGFKRTVVVEDATGTWCMWCPYAHAVLDILGEKYSKDQLIPIGVHSSTQGGDDPMNVMYGTGATYAGLSDYIGGFPTMLLNRSSQFGVTTSLEEQITNAVDNALKIAAPIEVEAEIEVDPSNELRPTIKSVVRTAANFTDSRFLLSYVVTEDGMGPYIQTNGFSGKKDFGDAYGFANQPGYVSLIYDNVALLNSTFSGVRNSLPATLEPGQEYEHNYKLSLKKVQDLNKYAINVLIIDQKTGNIANACRVYSPTYTGVEAIAADDNNITVTTRGNDIIVNGTDQYTVYDLAGRQVGATNLPTGIYIVNTPAKTVKIAL